MSHVEGEDRQERTTEQSTNDEFDSRHLLFSKEKAQTADGLRATYLVTVRVRATVEHALDLA